jgi:hypothetical protein
MTQQFLRVAQLKAFAPIFTGQGLGRDYTGLRVKFKIEKNIRSEANKATIKVFNMNEYSRTFLESEGTQIELSAGYPGEIKQIFIGDITKATSMKKSPDWITTLECGDGETKLRESHLEKSWGPGTPFLAIFQQGIRALGLDIGPQVFPITAITSNGFSFSGKAKDMLDVLAKRFGLEWSVQNGAVQVTQDGQPTPETAVMISPVSGLIGNVVKQEKFIEFKNLLNPEIQPGRLISIVRAAQIEGFFKCRRVVFDGDTHDGPWFSHVEAEPRGGS